MTDYVVDTDVVSYGFRQDTRFDFYRPLLAGNQAFVSFMDHRRTGVLGIEPQLGTGSAAKVGRLCSSALCDVPSDASTLHVLVGRDARCPQERPSTSMRGRLNCSDRNSAERSADDK
jgi:hypothetical protein